ncbi:MAG: type II toxin-antitoxin system VapB family antitoxin [bacterium]|nr:type II toxin-antitoxin system VapB family antitoxin [bacterium]
MNTAKLFTNGRSQAVRLPKECRFSGKDVYIKKLKGMVILIPKDAAWQPLIDSLEHFSSDFLEERQQPPQQERVGL